jgi:hypothetical protein
VQRHARDSRQSVVRSWTSPSSINRRYKSILVGEWRPIAAYFERTFFTWSNTVWVEMPSMDATWLAVLPSAYSSSTSSSRRDSEGPCARDRWPNVVAGWGPAPARCAWAARIPRTTWPREAVLDTISTAPGAERGGSVTSSGAALYTRTPMPRAKTFRVRAVTVSLSLGDDSTTITSISDPAEKSASAVRALSTNVISGCARIKTAMPSASTGLLSIRPTRIRATASPSDSCPHDPGRSSQAVRRKLHRSSLRIPTVTPRHDREFCSRRRGPGGGKPRRDPWRP